MGKDELALDKVKDELTWLERVWIEVQNEIAYEARHPQIGMCPWCGQALHPGRRCENDD